MRPLNGIMAAVMTFTTAIAIGGAPAQASPVIEWSACPDAAGVECATLAVPIDWTRPSGAKIDLALARRKAGNPAARIASVLVNPGGPGGSGVEWVKQGSPLSPAVAERFDIIGFDPRGIGGSHPILCDSDIAFEPYEINPLSPAAYAEMVDHNRRYGESCRRLTGPLFDFVDTRSVARDVDAIRAALGEAKLTYYGVSYGTLIGQQYAELFPGRVRALVLDSNMDHSIRTAWEFMRTESVGFQECFDEFVAWSNRTPDSPLAGQDARAVFNELYAKAERGELFVPGTTIPVTPLDLQFITFGSFYGPRWRALATDLAALQSGEPTSANSFGAANRFGEPIHDAFQAVFCLDWRLPLHSYYEFAAYRQAMRHVASPDVRFSPLGVLAVTSCQGWPAPTTNAQHRLRWRGAPPILMLNSRFDPATTYQWALEAARQSGAILLHYDGWGHGAYFAGSACVVNTVDVYLITRATPPQGTHCAAVSPESSRVQSGTAPPPTTRW